jgi:glycosyltransferase involved in cell wall biosynthesis
MSKSLNILFITKWYPNIEDPQSGVFVKKHALALSRQHAITLLYIHGLEKASQRFEIEVKEGQIKEVIVYFRKRKNRVINALLYFIAFAKVRKECIDKTDLVIANILTRPALLAYFYKVFYKTKYVVWEHWTGYHDGSYEKLFFMKKWLNKWLIKKAQKVFCVSSHLEQAMKKHLFHTDYYVIPNVVNLPDLGTEIRRNEKIKILTVADHEDWYKNISGSITAFSQIVQLRDDFEFHLIGGGKDLERLKKLASDFGLLDTHIFFHGRQPNEKVLTFIKEIDFALINSNFETFSVFAIEALSCGKPVIATISGGPEEFINEKNGVLIHKQKPEELINAITLMMDGFSEYDKEEISNTVRRFAPEKIVEKFNQIYVV